MSQKYLNEIPNDICPIGKQPILKGTGTIGVILICFYFESVNWEMNTTRTTKSYLQTKICQLKTWTSETIIILQDEYYLVQILYKAGPISSHRGGSINILEATTMRLRLDYYGSTIHDPGGGQRKNRKWINSAGMSFEHLFFPGEGPLNIFSLHLLPPPPDH